MVNKAIKINYNFILILLVVIFKYLKVQNILNGLSNTILLIFICMVIISVIRKRFISNVDINKLVLAMILAVIQFLFLHDIDILIMILIAITFSKTSNAIYKISKYFCISIIAIFLVTIVLNKLGILDSYMMIRRNSDGIVRMRDSFGFSHPNCLYLYYFLTILSIYYIAKNKKVFSIITLISSIVMYNVTLSRTGFICTIFFLILIWFYPKKIKINKYLFLGGTILTLLIAILYGKETNNTINQLLSNRPIFYYYYIDNELIFNLIGNNIVSKVPLDNMYLGIIITSGWIIYLFYLVLYVYTGEKIEEDRKLTNIYIITMIYGCFETHSLNIGINFLMLIISYMFFIKTNNVKEKSKNE